MAKETKVGLVVGLAFIICFAVILANRGRQTPLATHVAYDVDSGTTVGRDATASLPTSAVPRRNDTTRRLNEPAAARQARLASRSDTGTVQGQHSVRGPRTIPTSGARVALSGTREREHTPAAQAPGSAAPTRGAANLSRSVDAAETSNQASQLSALPSASQERQARRQQLQEYLDAGAAGSAQPAAESRSRMTLPVEQPATSVDRKAPAKVEAEEERPVSKPGRTVRYTVAPGDTLSRIARKKYGTRTTKAINAIFEANRSVLASPDVLRVGMSLTLPEIEGSGPPARVVDGSPAKPVAAKAATPEPTSRSWRWYQIKKNDRYSSIAKRELGDASRWREIFELNREKFPDPQRIREGVRIKLPAASLATAKGRRR